MPDGGLQIIGRNKELYKRRMFYWMRGYGQQNIHCGKCVHR